MNATSSTNDHITVQRIVTDAWTAMSFRIVCGSTGKVDQLTVHFDSLDPQIRELPAMVDEDLPDTSHNFNRCRVPLFIPQMTDLEEDHMQREYEKDCEAAFTEDYVPNHQLSKVS